MAAKRGASIVRRPPDWAESRAKVVCAGGVAVQGRKGFQAVFRSRGHLGKRQRPGRRGPGAFDAGRASVPLDPLRLCSAEDLDLELRDLDLAGLVDLDAEAAVARALPGDRLQL